MARSFENAGNYKRRKAMSMATRPERLACCLCVLLAVWSGCGYAADAPPGEDARRAVLEARLKQIEVEQKASAAQYVADKKGCANKIFVSRCTSDALARRRSRDDVLTHADTSARAELRGLAVVAKNRSLAESLPGSARAQDAEKQRSEALSSRAGKMADVQERRAEHERKKTLEAENRAAWEAKQARSQEKLAENEAKRKAAEKAAELAAQKAAQNVTAAGSAVTAAKPAASAPQPAAAGLKASVN